jgi:teichuronic acid exporter
MNLRNVTSEALRWSLGSRFLTQIVSWLATLVVIRLLHPEDYGVMAMVISVLALAELVTDGGLTAVIVNRSDMTDEQVGAIISFSGCVTTLLFLAIFFSAPLVSTFYGEDITNVLRVASLVLPFRALGRVRDALLVQGFNFRTKAIIETVSVLVQSAVTLGAALADAGVWALVVGALAGAIARALGLAVTSGSSVRPNLRFDLVRPLLGYSGAVLAQRVLFWATGQIDIILLSRVAGAAQLGIYATAKELAALPQNKVAASLNQVSFAAFSAVKDDMRSVRFALRESLSLLSITVFPIFFAISAFSLEIQKYVLGDGKWQGVAQVLLIWALIPPFRMINGHLLELLNGLGRADVPAKNMVLGLVALVPALWVGLSWGVVGAAIAYLVVTPMLTLTLVMRIKRLGIASASEVLGPIVLPFLAASSAWLTVALLRPVLEGNGGIAPVTSMLLLMMGGVVYLGLGLILARERVWSALSYVHLGLGLRSR